ncbi:MAG: hypothetical protein N3C60_01870 [Calditerrivibrio sp.]|nr:hypothetical protein [Calditerrivibrio sp.]
MLKIEKYHHEVFMVSTNYFVTLTFLLTVIVCFLVINTSSKATIFSVIFDLFLISIALNIIVQFLPFYLLDEFKWLRDKEKRIFYIKILSIFFLFNFLILYHDPIISLLFENTFFCRIVSFYLEFKHKFLPTNEMLKSFFGNFFGNFIDIFFITPFVAMFKFTVKVFIVYFYVYLVFRIIELTIKLIIYKWKKLKAAK